MTSRVIETAADRDSLFRLLSGHKMPYTVTVARGKKRSLEQNRLQWMWCNEAAEQLQDETPEEKRAYCKLHFGVPILRAASENFREQYDRLIRPLSYEQKLDLMCAPIDFPVTRLMTTKQMSQYHDLMYQHFASQGVQLTEPEAA